MEIMLELPKRKVLPIYYLDVLIYIAHIDGTSIDDMVTTAVRLGNEGLKVMPHFPARIIKDKPTLSDWIDRYASEAGVKQALYWPAGSIHQGSFDSSMQLLETELFDKYGFTDLNVAGHPEEIGYRPGQYQ